jgi:transcriptional regulator with XRE-family HTH domain
MSLSSKESEVRKIGRQFRILRERSGRTIAQLSRAAGLSERAVRDLEAGRTNPSLATVVSIVDVLGANLNDLVEASRRSDVVSDYTSAAAATETTELTRSLRSPRMRARIVQLGASAATDTPANAVFGYVLADSVAVALDGQETLLRHGDSFHARAGVLRGWRSQTSAGRLLVVEAVADDSEIAGIDGRQETT